MPAVRRSDTLTRENIQAANLSHPKLDQHRSDYAERLVEIVTGHTWRWLRAPHQKRSKEDKNCRLPRLVARVERLLAPKERRHVA